MTERPSSLVRRSLGSNPARLTVVFFAAFGALLAMYLASDATHGDTGGAVAASVVLAAVITIGAWRMMKRWWWRRLHALPVPLDVASYLRALDHMADHAHLELQITFAGATAPLDELTTIAGAHGSVTTDGSVANLVGPRLRTVNLDTRPRARLHSNAPLDRWFRRILGRLIALHARQPIQSISVTHVAG